MLLPLHDKALKANFQSKASRGFAQSTRPARRSVVACNGNNGISNPIVDRRQLVWLTGLSLAGSQQVFFPSQSRGADLDFDIMTRINKAFSPPPQPIFFPRKNLDLKFAVLLLRSGYEAADQLDFMPMNDFQAQFWKQRAAEQEGYALQLDPLKIRKGDVTDPLYFDYISYAQLLVLGRAMPKGQLKFEELSSDPDNPGSITVERNPLYADNSKLPPAFFNITGDNIYFGLKDGFRDEAFGAPAPLAPGAKTEDILENCQKILDIMVDRGFALKSKIVDAGSSENGTRFKIKTEGPATLWSIQALAYNRSPVTNCYDAMAVTSYLRQCGKKITNFEFESSETALEEEISFI